MCTHTYRYTIYEWITNVFLNKNFHLPAINFNNVSRKLLYENGKSFVLIINRKFVNFIRYKCFGFMCHIYVTIFFLEFFFFELNTFTNKKKKKMKGNDPPVFMYPKSAHIFYYKSEHKLQFQLTFCYYCNA